VLQRPETPPAVVRHSAAVVERQARNLARLLDDLLDLSRITRGRIELRPETVSIAEAVTHALDATRPLIDARGHTVTVAMPPAPLYVHADPARLEQIIVNILNNAARYTPNGGKISIVADEDNGELLLSISDTGAGIPKDMLDRIFQPFVQGDRSLAHASGGLGIGLALVHRLVEMHRGRVEAYSEGPGRGSRFTIRLPLQRACRAADADTASPASTAERCPPASVLLIEDNADARQTLRMLLEEDGHRVDEAADGASGLERAAASRPDIILVDIGLPGADGYEVARRIRARRGHQPILVAISGYGQADDQRRSHEAGFDAHLTKPVFAEQLARVLATLARRRAS
jgi:CheY-like chemotaxis protein/anti-sigma regulatory factor (Ser/Thr protein kinase)